MSQESDEARGTRRERHRVRGDEVIAKVKEIIHEGNVRRVIIKNDEGRTLIEIPLSLGVAGAVLVPVWAALGAIAALVTSCSIEVVREGEEEEPGHEEPFPEEEGEGWGD